jgi:diguanylate cyclase (GGDEF)-like protein
VAGAAAPIRVAGELWGALALASDDPERVGPAAAARLERFAELISLAIANAESLQRLIDEATTDALTRLANYRTFHERLREEFERFRRYAHGLTLVLLDLDHFKALNDQHGHQAGDHTLATFAEVLRGQARDGDTVARIGGEEFAWLMPEASAADGLQAAERLRQAVEETAFPGVGGVTVSIGVCGAEEAANGLELVRQADHALYAAKRRGRNQCRRYTPDLPRTAVAATGVRELAGRDHSDRVASWAEQLALALGWAPDRARQLREAALLGDVLTPEQAAWIRGHHERWDGTGYPDALRGADIPDGARILAVADAYDALTTVAGDAERRSHADAVEECRRARGRLYCPAVVDALGALDLRRSA